jgi:hypothetical protein
MVYGSVHSKEFECAILHHNCAESGSVVSKGLGIFLGDAKQKRRQECLRYTQSAEISKNYYIPEVTVCQEKTGLAKRRAVYEGYEALVDLRL